MKLEELQEELHTLARQMGVTVRYERGDFEGGYCILRENKILLVNRRLQAHKKASILAVGLNEIGLENIFIKPAVRHFIEDEAAKAAQARQSQESTEP
jgi:hypothetical protein